ncbi:hypothetical protein K4A83_10285 [Spirulina subsalsa FACHB-351]|uniref:NfeD-like C-terminal domain-containing protein n=1 Tax=Spirulina subsalsa FACHB-351 TaxID=234711 RepID=A0ABT3L552_9CYAN|nr:hypothetical protein [Spirulina subsalsa]MCW6036648.1 hypothetical protein [Spirulina subsalsa FACHB-351]
MNHRFLISKPQFFSTPLPGVLTTPVTPTQKGRIQFQGSFYPAQLFESSISHDLEPGTDVKVVGRIGIILLITR